jgi:hypothetical protein
LPDIVVILVIFGFIVLAIVGAVMSAKARRARTDALAKWAYANGWSFDAGPMEGDGRMFTGGGRCAMEPFVRFGLFDAGSDREFRNVITGEIPGRQQGGITAGFEAGDYRWETGSGKSRRTHRRSYLLFDLTDDLGIVPDLAIRPEGWGDKVWGALTGGGSDIDFESEEFSRRFHVTSSDRRFAFAVIDPRMMEFLLSSSQPSVEMRAGWGLLISQEEEWDPRDFSWAAGWVREFLEQWPTYLVKECRDRRW